MSDKMQCYCCKKDFPVLSHLKQERYIPEVSDPNCKVYIILDTLLCKNCKTKILERRAKSDN